MSEVFAGASAEENSPVAEHLRLTGGARVLGRDPSEYMADVIIKVAEERGEPVTGRLIVEAQIEGLLRPGSPFFEAAYGFDADTTRAIATDLLRWTNRDALIGPDLEPDRTDADADGDFRPGDRVRLVLNATSEGRRYPIGTTGLIVRAPTAQARATLAADGHHAVRVDDGADIIVVNGLAIERHGESPTPAPAPARPQWYFRDDVVELDRDLAIDGQPYSEGTTGTVLDLGDDTLVELAREGRIAVMFPGDDLEVVPVELLRPAGSAGRGPLRSPESCDHSWSQAGYRWGPVDRERGRRPFWSRSVCSGCGAERLHDSDQYYGDDMAIVHLKWRGSTW